MATTPIGVGGDNHAKQLRQQESATKAWQTRSNELLDENVALANKNVALANENVALKNRVDELENLNVCRNISGEFDADFGDILNVDLELPHTSERSSPRPVPKKSPLPQTTTPSRTQPSLRLSMSPPPRGRIPVCPKGGSVTWSEGKGYWESDKTNQIRYKGGTWTSFPILD